MGRNSEVCAIKTLRGRGNAVTVGVSLAREREQRDRSDNQYYPVMVTKEQGTQEG